MLRSYRKNHHGELRIPAMKRMAMRIDGELFKIVEDKARITMQPNNYVWIPITPRTSTIRIIPRVEHQNSSSQTLRYALLSSSKTMQ